MRVRLNLRQEEGEKEKNKMYFSLGWHERFLHFHYGGVVCISLYVNVCNNGVL